MAGVAAMGYNREFCFTVALFIVLFLLSIYLLTLSFALEFTVQDATDSGPVAKHCAIMPPQPFIELVLVKESHVYLPMDVAFPLAKNEIDFKPIITASVFKGSNRAYCCGWRTSNTTSSMGTRVAEELL